MEKGMMKAIAVLSPGVVKVVDNVPIPKIGDYEALCKVHACGFCNGTDIQIINGSMNTNFGGYPTVLGHEGAGEILEVGKKVKNIHVGERYIHPNLYTDAGNGYSKTHGSMAQYGLFFDKQAMLDDGYTEKDFPPFKQYKFPDTISYVDAGVLLSLGECHSACKNFGVSKGQEVLIYGAGPMGIALGLFSSLAGANVTQIDSVPERLADAIQIGKVKQVINFKTENVDEVLQGKKFDLVIDAVGATSILYEGSSRLVPKGKVCSLGVLRSNDQVMNVLKLQCNTSLHMLNFPYGEYSILDETIKLIEDGSVNPKDFYSHIVHFEKIDEVVKMIKNKTALKVILTFD